MRINKIHLEKLTIKKNKLLIQSFFKHFL